MQAHMFHICFFISFGFFFSILYLLPRGQYQQWSMSALLLFAEAKSVCFLTKYI